MKCCKARRCFASANISHLHERTIHFQIHASQPRRKSTLLDMLSSSGKFIFDGKPVCSEFLNKAFRFSRDLQQILKAIYRSAPVTLLPVDTTTESTPNQLQPVTPSTADTPTTLRSAVNVTTESSQEDLPAVPLSTVTGSGHPNGSGNGCDDRSESETSARDDILMKNTKAHSVIIFLQRLVSSTAERMPDTGEAHLPFIENNQVYEVFKREFAILNKDEKVPTFSYFTAIWKSQCSWVKVRKWSRFNKCSTCEQITASLRNAVTKGLPTDDIMRGKALHIDFVSRERREYRRKTELATLHPSSYLSLVVDGADQTKFALPHFCTSVKYQQGHGIAVHLIGLLRHGAINKLRLFTMTDEHASGANHIIEPIHRLINEIEYTEGGLPATLFLQLDICWRENKNRFLMAYWEYVLIWKVFQTIEVGFCPSGILTAT